MHKYMILLTFLVGCSNDDTYIDNSVNISYNIEELSDICNNVDEGGAEDDTILNGNARIVHRDGSCRLILGSYDAK